ncbi:MAG: hypothetical protein IPL39_17370 [Opitutaceae bacterium]|nr:hypothetical protein [Opitutaceae bacterium]
MKTLPRVLFLAAALSAVAPFASPLFAADAAPTTTSVAFTRPEAPHTLRVETMNGDVTIIGAEVRNVTVRSSGESTPQDVRREDGLRVIASSNSFSLTERDNVVRLSQDANALFSGGNNFEVTVPHDTTLIVKIGIHGDVTVRDLAGDIEISNLNGEVKLENVGGGVAVDTMNGQVSARYATLRDGKSHSFSSMNGKVLLYVPTTAKASFRLRAQNGTVATDFDEKVLITKTEGGGTGDFPGMDGMRTGLEAARLALKMAHNIVSGVAGPTEGAGLPPPEPEAEATPGMPQPPPPPEAPHAPHAPHAPRPPTFPAFGGQVVTGTLNGGGVEVRATTMNGEIQIREAK